MELKFYFFNLILIINLFINIKVIIYRLGIMVNNLKVIGFNGGWDNALKAGLTFDSRDFEPDPASGMMLQAAGYAVAPFA